MTEIVSTTAFHWILIIAVGPVTVWWIFHDIVFYARLRNADGNDPLVRDQRFGYAIGVVMAITAVIGTVLFMRHTGVI